MLHVVDMASNYVARSVICNLTSTIEKSNFLVSSLLLLRCCEKDSSAGASAGGAV